MTSTRAGMRRRVYAAKNDRDIPIGTRDVAM
jgi:hypothetical protein